MIPLLPENKPRIYLGSCDPWKVLRLVEMGVDMFDSSYAYHAAESGLALVFPNTVPGSQKKEPTSPPETLSLTTQDNSFPSSSNFHLDLRDTSSFKEDFSPISSVCRCHACRRHTRAYINHLLSTDELLGPVLLVMHNLHHYANFFEAVRECLESRGSLEPMKEALRGGCT